MDDTPELPQLDAADWLHGSLRTRLRARERDGDRDLDLYTSLALDGGDAERDAWTWRLDGQVLTDLDGAGDPDSEFFSLADAQGGDARGYLYEAYAERHDTDELASLRIGRQSDWETPVLLAFDGVRAATRPSGKARAELGGYAGRVVRLYDDAGSDDPVFGLWGGWRAWRAARLRIDWVHLEDEERLGAERNDLVRGALAQTLGERLRLDAAWSWLEGANRDASVRTTWLDAERDLALVATWKRLFEAQGVLAQELDPFTEALLEQAPYWEGRFTASKGFGERWRLEAGVEARRLEDDGDEGAFNHDFDRVWATATVARLPLELELALTGERWDAGDDGVDAWGAELSRLLASGARLSVGTDYALYKVDLFQLEERTDVRTWYARWRERRGAGWAWDLGYEYQDDPGADLHTLRIGGTWSF